MDTITIDIPKNQHIYSTGVLLLGPGNIQEYLRNLKLVSKLPLISVGSGNGAIERQMEEALDIRIICVDPTPLSWSMETADYREPEYATIEDVAREKPELIGQCNLFVNWAYPTHTFDMEAVQLMKPRNVITVTDVGDLRGAGGRLFHSWMHANGVDTKGRLDPMQSLDVTLWSKWKTESPYNYVFRTWTNYLSPQGEVEISIIWLSQDISNGNLASRSTEIPNSPLSVAVFAASAAAAAASRDGA